MDINVSLSIILRLPFFNRLIPFGRIIYTGSVVFLENGSIKHYQMHGAEGVLQESFRFIAIQVIAGSPTIANRILAFLDDGNAKDR